MKQFKRLVALVLAMALTLTLVGAAFADQGARTVDDYVEITGLIDGDQVTLYKVLEWNQGWVASSGFTTLTAGEIEGITGQKADGTQTGTAGTLSDAVISKIIGLAPSAVAVNGPVAVTGTTYQWHPEPDEGDRVAVDAGLYYALITPKEANTVYKPVFIAADYDRNTTNSVAISVPAKKETITVSKTATAQTNNQDSSANYTSDGAVPDANSFNTAGVGDIISFNITSQIPNFPANFTAPVFKVKDTLTDLTLDPSTISVSIDGSTISSGYSVKNYDESANAADTAGFTVILDDATIKANLGKSITVTYNATVAVSAVHDVDWEHNTAEIRFSNNPDDRTGANKLKDETKHYTFSIDALVNGNRKGTDLIKVGVDANGNEIIERIELPNENWAGALQGAKFTLYKDNNGSKGEAYKSYSNLVSDAQGLIQITGLDAGTYWLEETEAPAGFIKAQNPVKIEIIPVFKEVTVAATTESVSYTDVNGDTKTASVTVPQYTYAELESVTIKIDNATTSTYTVTNDAIATNGDTHIGATAAENTANTATGSTTNGSTGMIKNKQGNPLPSTGGIGTTIFYVAGIVLVLGAAAVIVARRKAEQE